MFEGPDTEVPDLQTSICAGILDKHKPPQLECLVESFGEITKMFYLHMCDNSVALRDVFPRSWYEFMVWSHETKGNRR